MFNFELVISSANHGLHVLNRSGHTLTTPFSEDYLQQARSSPGLQKLDCEMASSSTGNKSWGSEESWGEQRGSEVSVGGVGMGSAMGRRSWRSLYERENTSWPGKNYDGEAPVRGTGSGTLSLLLQKCFPLVAGTGRAGALNIGSPPELSNLPMQGEFLLIAATGMPVRDSQFGCRAVIPEAISEGKRRCLRSMSRGLSAGMRWRCAD